MNKRKIKIITNALYLISIAITLAMTTASKTAYSFVSPGMSIKKALLYSMKYNKMIRIAKIKLNIAGYEKNEALSGFFPKIGFNEIYLNTDNPLYAFGSVLNQKILTNQNVQAYFSPNFLNNPGMIHNYQSELQIEQPIFMGGRIYLKYQRAMLNKSALKQGLSESKQRVLFSVAKAYFSAVLAYSYVDMMQGVVKTAAAYEKLAKNMFNAGQVVSSDVLRAKVELAKMREKLVTAKKNYKLSRYFLNITIGIPINSKYKLTSKLTPPYGKLLSVNSLQNMAFANRPDYKALLINKKNIKVGIREANGKFLPEIVAGYNYFSNGPAIHPDDSYGYAFTVMLHLNIFSGLYDYNNLEKSKSQYNTIIEYKGLLRDKIQMQVRKAYLQYKAYLLNSNVAKLAVLDARQTLKITTNRYKAGMTTLVNLDRTLDQYKAAKVNYLNAIYKFNLNKYYIKLITGKLSVTP